MKKQKEVSILTGINYFVLLIIGIITFYPFYYLIIYSFSIPNEAINGVYFIPRGFTLTNFVAIFQRNNIGHAVLISSLRTFFGTILTVSCSSMFAYGISKNILPYRKTMYRMVIISMYFNAGVIPWYITMKALHLKDNFLLYILPTVIVAFFVVLFKTYFEQLPVALEESAMMDGAGYFRIFWRIIFPLSKPIVSTIALFQAVNQWNSWVDNFYLNPSENLMTLQLLLLNFLTEMSSASNAALANMAKREITVTPTSIRMSITVIAVIPIFCVYPFMQKQFIKGIMIGAVKG